MQKSKREKAPDVAPHRWGNPNGDKEDVDTTPLAMPMGYAIPTPLHELISRMVRQAVELETGEEMETETEADDFEEESDELLDMSKYEFVEIQEDYVAPEPEREAEPEPEPEPPTGDLPDPDAPEPDKP